MVSDSLARLKGSPSYGFSYRNWFYVGQFYTPSEFLARQFFHDGIFNYGRFNTSGTSMLTLAVTLPCVFEVKLNVLCGFRNEGLIALVRVEEVRKETKG